MGNQQATASKQASREMRRENKRKTFESFFYAAYGFSRAKLFRLVAIQQKIFG